MGAFFIPKLKTQVSLFLIQSKSCLFHERREKLIEELPVLYKKECLGHSFNFSFQFDRTRNSLSRDFIYWLCALSKRAFIYIRELWH